MALTFAPSLRNAGFFQIEITHLPTAHGEGNESLSFEGWVTEFSDDFTSTWNAETVYGRMDPLATFQNTSRKISLAFDVVSDNSAIAERNLGKVNRLIEFLYPVYAREVTENTRDLQNTLKASPLWGLKWTNLIATPHANRFLVGYVEGFSYAPDMEMGGFLRGDYVAIQGREVADEQGDQARASGVGHGAPIEGGETGTYQTTRSRGVVRNQYIPKVLNIAFNFTVLHTHLPGWFYKDGRYVFGSEDIDGKFPNASLQPSMLLSQHVEREVNSEGELVNQTILSGSVEEMNQADVLEGLTE